MRFLLCLLGLLFAISSGAANWNLEPKSQHVRSALLVPGSDGMLHLDPNHGSRHWRDSTRHKGVGTATYPHSFDVRLFPDHEDILRRARADEPRLMGYRRVENTFAGDPDSLVTGWALTNSSGNATRTYDAACDCTRLHFENSTDRITYSGAELIPGQADGVDGVISLYARLTEASEENRLRLRWYDGSSFITEPTVTLTTEWQRIALVGSDIVDNGSQTFQIRYANIASTPLEVEVKNFMIQEKSGAATKGVPDEYLDPDVDYLGGDQGVTGVAYFNYENGNTIASNIVTEKRGALIASNILKGYLAEGGVTNSAPDSEVGGGWSFAAITFSGDQAEAPDGRFKADLLLEDTSTGQHRAIATHAKTGAEEDWTLSVYVKKHTTSRDWMRLIFGDSTVTDWTAQYFNIDTCVPRVDAPQEVGSNFTVVTFGAEAGPNGWCRVWITANTDDDTGVDYWIQPATNDTTVSYTGDASTGMLVWGVQSEQGLVPTSIFPTSGGASARGEDGDMSFDAANAPSVTGSMDAQLWLHESPLTGTGSLVGDLSGARWLYDNNAGNVLSIYDGTTAGSQTVSGETYPWDVRAKVRVNATTGFKDFSLNATLDGETAYDGTMDLGGGNPLPLFVNKLDSAQALHRIIFYNADLRQQWLGE